MHAVLLILIILFGSSVAHAAEWQLIDGTKVHPQYRGQVPTGSDVVFSSRTKRDNSVEMAQAFGATRVEWVYFSEPTFIHALKKSAKWFGGTMSGVFPVPNDNAVTRDFDGDPIVPPWMKGWGAKWITTTHPAGVEVLKAHAARIIAAGADSIQFDDPLMQLHSSQSGGDFSRTTLEGFKKYLANYPDQNALAALGLNQHTDYREFLKSRHGIKDLKDYLTRYRSLPTTNLWTSYLRHSIREYFRDFRASLNSIAGRPFPLSMNLAILGTPDETNWHFFLAEFSDYAISETSIANLENLVAKVATHRALGVGFVPSLMPRELSDNRVAIALLYAIGAQPLVPWDVYVGNDEKGQPKRFYGTVADYEPLYAFVRKYPQLFDGTETPAVVGIPVPVDKFRSAETAKLVQRLVQMQVPFAFVLAGGKEWKFKIDPVRARAFKLLVSVNREQEFASEDLQVLRSLPVKQLTADQLTDDAIRELAPVAVVGGVGSVRVYPRAVPSRSTLLVHVIDQAKGATLESDRTCQRRVAVKKSSMPGSKALKATWYSPNSATKVAITETANEYAVAIRECRLWGILSLEFR